MLGIGWNDGGGVLAGLLLHKIDGEKDRAPISEAKCSAESYPICSKGRYLIPCKTKRVVPNSFQAAAGV